MRAECRKGILAVAAIVAATCLSAGSSFALEIEVIGRGSGLPSEWVRALGISEGKVWIGTGDRGVAVLDVVRKKVTDYSGEPKFTSKEIASIAAFGGKVYVGTPGELMVYDGSAWERLTQADRVVLRDVRVAASADGKFLWVCGMTVGGGTARFDGEKWTFMGGEGRGLFNNISSFAFGDEGTWMGAISGAVYLHKGSDVAVYSSKGISGNVFSLGKGADGALLAGTSAGLFRLSGSTWSKVAFPAEWGATPVFSIWPAGGATYLGTGAGVVRLKGGRMDRLTVAEGMPANRVPAVVAVGDAVYAGTLGGLAVVRGW